MNMSLIHTLFQCVVVVVLWCDGDVVVMMVKTEEKRRQHSQTGHNIAKAKKVLVIDDPADKKFQEKR